MHAFGDSRASVLWMIAGFGACLATVFYWILQKRYDRWTAALGGAMMLLIPTVQWTTSLVMIDLVCSLFALISVLFFARFLRTGQWRDSALFGLFCAIALLTKNSTFYLLLVPPIVIVAARRWTLLGKWELYVGPAVAAVLYLPWLAISNSFLWLGFNGLPHLTFWGLQRAYIGVFWRELSFLLPLAVLGLISWVFSKRTESDYVAWCLLALFPAIPLSDFIVRMPIESRYLILSLGAAIFLVCEFWSAVLPGRSRAVAMTMTFVVFGAISWMHFPPFPRNEMHAAVGFLSARDGGGPGAVIVPSNQEGPWIAEFAQNDSVRSKRILIRPTKVFGKEDWNGSHWEPFQFAGGLPGLFVKMPVKYCILSRSVARRHYPHDELLESAVARNPAGWRLVYSSAGRGFQIYENRAWTSGNQTDAAVLGELHRILPH